MCGICGIADGRETPDIAVVREMNTLLTHRGPDDEGYVYSGTVCLGARRLSIIDVVGGHQPVGNEDGSVWCAMNGEIYNHPALMADLTRRGHRFESRCDTETVVHMYEEYGLDFVRRLEGMFALAVWDAATRTLILARDALGIKPLYYSETGSRLVFASELKALLPAGISREVDRNALDAYLTLSYVPAPYSIFRDTKKLLPGHTLVWRPETGSKAEPYWSLPSVQPVDVGLHEITANLLDLLRKAVKSHMLSDVPLGAFLSGGLDSSIVVALMAEHSERPVRTFAIGFEEQSYDESPHARRVAEAFGCDHSELILKPDPRAVVERLGSTYDEPFADSSAVATYAVAELARQRVTVALTGDGGDEIFGGYLTYRADKVARGFQSLPGPIREQLITRAVNALPTSDRKTSFDYKAKRFVRSAGRPAPEAHLGWKTIFTAEARAAMVNERQPDDVVLRMMMGLYAQAPAHDAVGKAMFADTCLGLPDDMLTKVDRATMAVSLEARVPLLDRSVVEFMARLPTRYKVHGWTLKFLLKQATKDMLPPDINRRKKAGFNVPVARWLRSDLRDVMMEALSPTEVRNADLFDPTAIQTLIQEHDSGRADHGRELWCLLTFALWSRHYRLLPSAHA